MTSPHRARARRARRSRALSSVINQPQRCSSARSIKTWSSPSVQSSPGPARVPGSGRIWAVPSQPASRAFASAPRSAGMSSRCTTCANSARMAGHASHCTRHARIAWPKACAPGSLKCSQSSAALVSNTTACVGPCACSVACSCGGFNCVIQCSAFRQKDAALFVAQSTGNAGLGPACSAVLGKVH